MKTTVIKIFSVLTLLMPVISCKLIENLADIDFDITLPITFTVNETEINPSGKNYSSTKVLSVASDPEVTKYAKKIKEFKVKKITYTISQADPTTVAITNGQITTNSGKVIASAASIDLSNNSETTLTTNNDGIKELCSSLLNSNEEQVKLNADLSETPVGFTAKITFYLNIIANPLE